MNTKLTKLVSATALSVGLAVLPATIASATTTTTSPDTTGTTTTGTTDVRRDDNNFDWGWLGLLGLLGLAGLTGRKEEPTRYREPDVTTRTTGTGSGSDRY